MKPSHVQIVGQNLEPIICYDWDFEAYQTYCGPRFEVWEMPETSFEILESIPEEEFSKKDAWWRRGESTMEGTKLHQFTVRNKPMLGYLNEEIRIEINEKENDEDQMPVSHFTGANYRSFTEYLEYVLQATNESNITALATSLAKANDLSLGDFFKRYEGKRKSYDEHPVLCVVHDVFVEHQFFGCALHQIMQEILYRVEDMEQRYD